jgi:integrase
MKRAKPYPYLYKDIDRQGHIRWRLRGPRRPTVTIKGEFGSPEFATAYRAAMEGDTTTRCTPTKHGTIGALARSYLRSTAFSRLAKGTQAPRRRIVEGFVVKYGNLPVAGLRREHVQKIMDGYTPGMARNILSMLRVLMALAIEEGTRTDDPSATVKRPKLRSEGWHTWTEEEIAAFEAKHPIGTKARLAFALALYTGQRNSDLIKIGRQHVRDGMISVCQQKTGTRLWVPIHPELKAIMDATPSGDLTLLISDRGAPYAAAS